MLHLHSENPKTLVLQGHKIKSLIEVVDATEHMMIQSFFIHSNKVNFKRNKGRLKYFSIKIVNRRLSLAGATFTNSYLKFCTNEMVC